MIQIQRGLAATTAFITLALLARVLIDRFQERQGNPKTRNLLALAVFLAVLFAITLLVHWFAFHTLQILLPKGRTALFFVPIMMLVLGVSIAIRFQTGGRDLLRLSGVTAMAVLAISFLFCLRLSYFKEWRYNSDAKHLYWILNDLNRRCRIRDFVTEWRYVGALNFYRICYVNTDMKEFVSAGSRSLFAKDKPAYVLYYWDAKDFIRQQNLKLLYLNERTGAAIAMRSCNADSGPAAR